MRLTGNQHKYSCSRPTTTTYSCKCSHQFTIQSTYRLSICYSFNFTHKLGKLLLLVLLLLQFIRLLLILINTYQWMRIVVSTDYSRLPIACRLQIEVVCSLTTNSMCLSILQISAVKRNLLQQVCCSSRWHLMHSKTVQEKCWRQHTSQSSCTRAWWQS